MKTRVIQKAVLLNAQKEMLMLRRSKTDIRRPLQWDLPGGFREEGEELIAGVQREIEEETGLNVSDLKPLYSQTEIRTWKSDKGEHTENVVYIIYAGPSDSKDVELSYEHDEYQWKTINEAVKEFEYKTQRDILKYIIEHQLLS